MKRIRVGVIVVTILREPRSHVVSVLNHLRRGVATPHDRRDGSGGSVRKTELESLRRLPSPQCYYLVKGGPPSLDSVASAEQCAAVGEALRRHVDVVGAVDAHGSGLNDFLTNLQSLVVSSGGPQHWARHFNRARVNTAAAEAEGATPLTTADIPPGLRLNETQDALLYSVAEELARERRDLL